MNHWNDLFVLILLVSACYLLLSLCLFGLTQYVRKRRINEKYLVRINKFRLFYKPTAWMIIIAGFVTLDPVSHGFMILLLVGIGYKQVGNYISGLFIRASPLLATGTKVKAGNIHGRVTKIGSLGMVLGTDQGEEWVWYNSFDRAGFTLISNQTNEQQRSIYVKSELPKVTLQNLIVEHPILALGKPARLKSLNSENTYLLHYTLVKGAQNEDFINYLHDHQAQTNSTEKFDS